MKQTTGQKKSVLGLAEQTRLETDLDIAHCGHLKKTMVDMMARAQIFKDRTMANALVRETGGGSGVLIAGNGHIRKDYGVPNYLTNSVSVAFMEIEYEDIVPTDYDAHNYDYLWFTARVDDEDPCKKFEDQLKKMKQRPLHK